MVEAMACGTPVLAFAGGSVEEVVVDGVNGWICRDVDEMARRIASPGVAASACRRFVEVNFSVAKMTQRYLDVYRCASERVRSAARLEA